MTYPAEALIMGGGPAGAACAAQLATEGRRVVLLERDARPTHKVCGEFLSFEAVRLLAKLGIDLEVLGAVPIERLRLVSGRHVAEARLPFVGMSLSRLVLDEALLRHAAASGAVVRRGAKVQTLQRLGQVWKARLSSGEIISGEAAFVATGKHELRGWPRPRVRRPEMVAFKQHLYLSPSMAADLTRCVELILFDRGYGGLEPIENGRANLCLLVQRDRLVELGGSWSALVAAVRSETPLLDQHLEGARPCWQPAAAMCGIPFGHLAKGSNQPWRLGDQAAVVPSFTGSGVSIALGSAQLATEMFLAGRTADEFHRRLAGALSGVMLRSMAVSRFMLTRRSQRLVAQAAAHAPVLLTWGAKATRLARK